MKTLSLKFSFLLLFFILLNTNLYAAATYSCDGETVSNLDGATSVASASYVEGVDTNQNIRYFKFKTKADGVVSVTQENKDRLVSGWYNHRLQIGTSCGAKDIYNGPPKTKDSHTFAVEKNSTYYVRVIEGNLANVLNFYIDFNFIDSASLAAYYPCAKPKPFSLRANYVLPGDLLAIGNSNVCADDDYNDICDTNQKKRNDNSNIIFINSSSSTDVDSSHAGKENTSAANLSLPAGATVKWAGLYWQGEVWDINLLNTSNIAADGSTAIENGADGQARKAIANTIKLQVPGGSYQDITADEHYYFFVRRNHGYNSGWSGINRYEEHYQSFKDITTLVQNAGDGDYWVANIQATVGKLRYPGVEAAWTLQIIYEYPDSNPRSISINDGFFGLYDTGDDGDSYVNEVNSLYGSSCLTGGVNTGAYDNSVSFDIDGFITPKKEGFTTDMTIFVTESDPDGLQVAEILEITKKDSSVILVDGPGAWNYEILNKDGTDNLDRTPAYIYPIGMTIKNYSIIDLLSPEQTSTTVTFETGYDRLMLGVIGFATDLRKPNLCYDYGYSQYGRYFTESFDFNAGPMIEGNVDTGVPIDVKIYIKNTENSDIIANSMKISILDINTSVVNYISNSVEVTLPNSSQQTSQPDSGLNITATSIEDINIGTLHSLEYFYTYYQLNPLVSDINTTINARVDYNVTLDAGGTDITIPYSLYLNSDIPMCSGSSVYSPNSGIFNIVHDAYIEPNTSTTVGSTSGYYYNLPTQVTSRVGNFNVVSMDPENLDTRKNVSTPVWVELIDVSAFHDTNASCNEPSSAISDKILIQFDNNVSIASFKRTDIETSLIDNFNKTISTPEEFYQTARENTAFRVSYMTNNDENSSLLETSVGINGTVIENFTTLIQDIGQCVQPVYYPAGGSGNFAGPSDNISNACGNAGGVGVSDAYLQSCMACLFGYNTKVVCSRDNFAIRPEAFMIKIDDQNQSNPIQKLRIDDNKSGVVTLLTHQTELAAGYTYNIEINATNHQNNISSHGYTYLFGNSNNELFMQEWSPTTLLTGCNDENNVSIVSRVIDGSAVIEHEHNQVGEYNLHMRDRTWTNVDSDIHNNEALDHHTGIYFLSGDDCANNSNTVNINSTSLIGCDISSNHNSSNNSNLKYRDYDIEFHPYRFDMNNTYTITSSYGENNSTIWPAIPYLYMADMNKTQNMNDNMMSFHLGGFIGAVGENNSTLSNYVKNCYAKPIQLTIDKNHITTPIGSTYSYKFDNRDINNINITGYPITLDINETTLMIDIAANDFTQTLNGSINTLLYLNFDRNQTRVANPESITYNSYTSNCTVPADCTMNADLTVQSTLDGNATTALPTPLTIQHYYGRSHATHNQYVEPDNQIAFIYYEVYCDDIAGVSTCDPLLLQNSTDSNSTNDPRWFVNTNHTEDYGVSNLVTQKGASVINEITAPDGNHQDEVEITYNESRGYPYKATMEINSSSWLIYNKYDDNIDINEFSVEFRNASGDWAGISDTNATTTDQGTTQRTNRRTMW